MAVVRYLFYKGSWYIEQQNDHHLNEINIGQCDYIQKLHIPEV